jgi:hypothetical protein
MFDAYKILISDILGLHSTVWYCVNLTSKQFCYTLTIKVIEVATNHFPQGFGKAKEQF